MIFSSCEHVRVELGLLYRHHSFGVKFPLEADMSQLYISRYRRREAVIVGLR